MNMDDLLATLEREQTAISESIAKARQERVNLGSFVRGQLAELTRIERLIAASKGRQRRAPADPDEAILHALGVLPEDVTDEQ